MDGDWRARIDTLNAEESERDRRRLTKQEERRRKWQWKHSQSAALSRLWPHTSDSQRDFATMSERIGKLRCCVCGKPDTLQPSDADASGGLIYRPTQAPAPFEFEPEKLSLCRKCGRWACNERRPEPHIYKGMCRKCAE